MQEIARELNNAETAFIFSPTAPDHDVWIRFLTPTTEVPSCGHATIAAHYVRAIENDLSSSTIQQRIGIGILPVDIVKKDSEDGSITFKGKQGEAIGRPGIVTVTVEVKDGRPFKVQVGGDATIAFKTEIAI